MINTKRSNKTYLTPNDILLKPLKIKFDITTLDMVIAFIYKTSVLRTRKTLMNLYKIFTNLDESKYENNSALLARIWIIQKTLEGRIDAGFENDDNIKQYCLNDADCDEYRAATLENILSTKKISYDESKYIVKKMDDVLNFGYSAALKELIEEKFNSIDNEDVKSYEAISNDLYAIGTAIVNIKRTNTSLGSDQTFSLDNDTFSEVITDAVEKLKDRNRIFITGVQRWNTILSPGYLSKRLYTYLAFPGKGKSLILLKSALDIKKYNRNIKTKDPDKRPAVLFLTLENDIAETVERMYNMAVDSDDIRNYSPKQIIRKFKEKGNLTLTDDNNIDIIIKEYKNRELDTNDLYSIINDLSDEGVEVIALIIDYMKRIRPAEKANDEKSELKNITNEMKEVAKYFDIPVNNSGLIITIKKTHLIAGNSLEPNVPKCDNH